MVNFRRNRRAVMQPRTVDLHHICGHTTPGFNLDCFNTGKVRQLEALPCANCVKRTTKAPVMSLCLGNLINGVFHEDRTRDITADSRVQFLIGTGEEEIVLTFPRLYPFSIASRYEVAGATTYTVLYRAHSS